MRSIVRIRLTGSRIRSGSCSNSFAGSARTIQKPIRPSRKFGTTAIPLSRETSSSPTASRSMSSTASTSKLIELAATITRETEKLDKYMNDNGLPTPSFEVDTLSNFPKLDGEMKKAREEVVRATKELGDLITGPTESMRWMAWDVSYCHPRFKRSLLMKAAQQLSFSTCYLPLQDWYVKSPENRV